MDTNTVKEKQTLKYLKPLIIVVLFLLVAFTLTFYLLTAGFADETSSFSRVFLYTIPLYVFIIIISFISKFGLSWAPISLLLFSISSMIIFRYGDSSPSFLNLPMMLGIGVLLDVICLGLSMYEENKIVKTVKKVILGITFIAFMIVGVYLLQALFTENWLGTPFSGQLKSVYRPFSLIIIITGVIYYLFLIFKPDNLISKKQLGYLNGSLTLIIFILALVMIIIPLFVI